MGHQGEHGGAGELAGAEQLRRQHRVAAAPLHGGKDGCCGQAGGRGGYHRRSQAAGGLDQGKARTCDGEHGERGTAQVQAAGMGRVPGLWHPQNRGDDDECPERNVDQDDRTPRQRVGQVAAEGRAGRGRDRRQACPRADRPGAVTGIKGRVDEGKAPGSEQSSPIPCTNRAVTSS